MDYEREKGRINGLRTRRQKSRAFAHSMIPILTEARKHVPDRWGEGASKRGLARWLNENGYKSVQGGKFTDERIDKLYDIHVGMIEEVEEEYIIAFNARKYVLESPQYPDRNQIMEELSEIEEQREVGIDEAQRLSAALQGKIYRYTPAPPPLLLTNAFVREPSRWDRLLARRERNVTNGEKELEAKEARLAEDMKSVRQQERAIRAIEDAAFSQALALAGSGRELALLTREQELERRTKNLRLRGRRLSFREKELVDKERRLERKQDKLG